MQKLLLTCLCCIAFVFSLAQDIINLNNADTVVPQSNIQSDTSRKVEKYSRNNIKFNISALSVNNYSFFYERSISRKISFQAGYRYMPASKLSEVRLSKQVLNNMESEDNYLEEDLDKITSSGNAITAEFRFYTGRKPGARGFYFSVYGRYSSFKIDYDYDYSTGSEDYLIPLESNIKGIGGGILLGTQFLIAKRVILDIYVIGAHYGSLNGTGSGVTDLSGMTDMEQSDLKYDLESFEVLGKNLVSAEVNDNGVNIKIKGPFMGVRVAGISLGFAF